MTFQKQVSVRELGGEIWAELERVRQKDDSQFKDLDYQACHHLTDFIMSILARHIGVTIFNNAGLEVEPLAKE